RRTTSARSDPSVVLSKGDYIEGRRSRRLPHVRRMLLCDGAYSDRRFPFGHVPDTRISPSAGMPGLANPVPSFSWSLTPTTCFTRSSRKYVFSGVNVACGSMRDTYASIALLGFESRKT